MSFFMQGQGKTTCDRRELSRHSLRIVRPWGMLRAQRPIAREKHRCGRRPRGLLSFIQRGPSLLLPLSAVRLFAFHALSISYCLRTDTVINSSLLNIVFFFFFNLFIALISFIQSILYLLKIFLKIN